VGHVRTHALLCLFTALAASQAQAISVNAVFEVRSPGGQPTVTLHEGGLVDLEVWLTLNLTDGTSIPGVYGTSFYLDLDAATENNIISFSMDPPLSPPAGWLSGPTGDGSWVYNSSVWAAGHRVHNVNTPVTGTFAAGTNSSFPGTVAFASGVATKVGTFSIVGLNEGTATYSFAGRTGDPLLVSFASAVTTSYANGPSLTITVLPEPAAAAGLLLGIGLLSRRRR